MGIGIPYVMPVSFSIDAATLGLKYARERSKGHSGKERPYLSGIESPSVSVIIPAYNAEKSLEATVTSIYSQTMKPKTVIVVDDCSTDTTPEICLRLEYGIDNFFHMRREKNSGKATNINYIVREFKYLLGDITVVVDSDILLDKDCIEKLVKNFTSGDVAAVTPYGYTLPPDDPVARMLHYGNSWNNEVFSFRKKAQCYRNAISVICGAGTAYRTKVLRSVPVPTRTKTEDTDYTWLLQELGYKVNYEGSAIIYSHDLEKPSGMLRQWHRWYSGTFQSIFMHGKNLFKAKKMFWTTVLPSVMESVPYSLGIVTLPVIAAANIASPGALQPFGMHYVAGFLAADFLFTVVPTAVISSRYLRRIPEIYAYKFVGSALTLAAFFRTCCEKFMRRQSKWNNAWSKNYDFTRGVSVNRITEEYLAKNISKFFSLEDNWTGIGEQPWDENKFLHELPKKWSLSFALARGDAIMGYIIGSQAGENTAKVNKILVDKQYRKSGFGKILLWVFEEECLKNGITEVELKALRYNRQANGFYLNQGYVPAKMVKGTDGKMRKVYRKKLC